MFTEHQQSIIRRMQTKNSHKSLDISRDSSQHDISYSHSVKSSPRHIDLKQAQANVERCQLNDEKKRLKLQESITKKLERISNKNRLMKNKTKKIYIQKFEKYKSYLHKLKDIEVEKSEKYKEIESAKIERFRVYNEYLDKQKAEQKKLKQKEKQRIENLDEKIKIIKEKEEEKRKEVEERLLHERSRVNKYNLIRMNSLEKKVNKGLSWFNENSKYLNSYKDSLNKQVLVRERNALEKSQLKENSFDLSRHNV